MTEQIEPKKENTHYCRALIKTCRSCGKTFENFMAGPRTCPDCGDSRECGITPLPGYEYCYRHGGPKLPYNKRLANGVGSKFPIVRLAAKYAEEMSNPEISTLKGARLVLQNRTYELLDRIEDSRNEDRMGTLQNLWSKFQEARYRDKDEDIRYYATAIDDQFEQAFHDYQSWDQIIKILGEERKMAETQVKIFKDLKLMYTAEQVYDAIAQLLGVIIKVEKDDPIKLEVISREFAQFVGDADIIDIEPGEPQAPQYRPSAMDIR